MFIFRKLFLFSFKIFVIWLNKTESKSEEQISHENNQFWTSINNKQIT